MDRVLGSGAAGLLGTRHLCRRRGERRRPQDWHRARVKLLAGLESGWFACGLRQSPGRKRDERPAGARRQRTRGTASSPGDGVSGAPIAITSAGTLYWMQFDFGWKGIVLQPSTSGGKVVDEFSGHGVTWLQNDRLAFGRDGADVFVRTLQSRMERAYPRNAVSALAPRVFGDGSAAVLYVPSFGDGGNPGGGFYQLDFTTGAFKRLFSRDDAGRVRSSVSALSPDNRTLYLGVLTGSPSRWSAVVATAVDSGLERRIMPLPASIPPVQGIAVSPDGRMLALHTNDGRIFTAGVDDGSLREVVKSSPGGGWPEVVQWSRDGRYIIYGTRSDPASTDWRLMRVRSSGGVAEPAGVDSSRLSRPGRLMRFEFSPDDGKVAVSVRNQPTVRCRCDYRPRIRLPGGAVSISSPRMWPGVVHRASSGPVIHYLLRVAVTRSRGFCRRQTRRCGRVYGCPGLAGIGFGDQRADPLFIGRPLALGRLQRGLRLAVYAPPFTGRRVPLELANRLAR